MPRKICLLYAASLLLVVATFLVSIPAKAYFHRGSGRTKVEIVAIQGDSKKQETAPKPGDTRR